MRENGALTIRKMCVRGWVAHKAWPVNGRLRRLGVIGRVFRAASRLQRQANDVDRTVDPELLMQSHDVGADGRDGDPLPGRDLIGRQTIEQRGEDRALCIGQCGAVGWTAILLLMHTTLFRFPRRHAASRNKVEVRTLRRPGNCPVRIQD